MKMRDDIRAARVEKYGSFLYCPDRDTLCFGINNELGICSRAVCVLDDPEDIKLQKRIEKNRKKLEQMQDREESQTNIRNQSGKASLLMQIKEKEKLSQELYSKNRPNLAETVWREAQIMRGNL